MFRKLQPADRINRAKQHVQKMGYEFQITRVSFSEKDNQTIVEVALKNQAELRPFIMTGKSNWAVFQLTVSL